MRESQNQYQTFSPDVETMAEIALAKEKEFRDLVQTYAGQIFVVATSITNGSLIKNTREWSIKQAHAQAKAVLESLEEEV